MTEGLFWLICQMDGDAIDGDENWEIYHQFVKSDTISHKDAWRQFVKNPDKRFRGHEYNHYPCGRVVVRNDAATVFLNCHIATDEVLAAINKVLGLTAPKVHADGSRHYECYIDKGDKQVKGNMGFIKEQLCVHIAYLLATI